MTFRPHLALPFNSQVGPIRTKSYFLPDLHHIGSEGTFWQVINNGKVKFSKIWILVPIWPPLKVLNGAKSYFLPNLYHFYSEWTFLQVITNGKVIWQLWGGQMGTKIHFFDNLTLPLLITCKKVHSL